MKPTRNAEHVTIETSERSPDWSLRANGDTYVDRRDESTTLMQRLTHSSASVTGIAGQRGAGKSSLALKVLAAAEGRGAFTLLIHSPTGYDPKEFLIAIFLRVCEETITRINQKFGEAESLLERGKAEARRLSRTYWALAFGLLFVSIGTLGYGTFSAYQEYAKALSMERQATIEMRKADLDSKITEVQSRLEKAERKLTDITIDETAKAELESLRSDLRDELDYFRSYATGMERELTREMPNVNLPLTLLPVILFTLFFYVLAFLGFRSLRSIGQQRRHARDFPNETGLRKLAVDLSERLEYQTTLTSSSEAGLSALKIVSKWTQGKSLETRPLSLPGLTAQLGQFLELTSQIYPDGVVICLDELDKIEDPDELDQLLRGIKGILGQRSTHFLLTVSDDALARFSTRRRADRGMLESAFEEIITLDEVDLSGAAHMLNVMSSADDRGGDREGVATNVIVLWIFGSGIPREIKRNALACLQVGLHPLQVSAEELWRFLFRRQLDSMMAWGARVGRDDEVTAGFLDCLEVSDQILRQHRKRMDPELWTREFVSVWREYAGKIGSCPSDDGSDENKEGFEHAFGRGMIELVVDGTSLICANKHRAAGLSGEGTRDLLAIFKFMPSNFSFANRLCWEYVDGLDLTSAAERGRAKRRGSRVG